MSCKDNGSNLTLEENVKQPKGIYFSGLQAKAWLGFGRGVQREEPDQGQGLLHWWMEWVNERGSLANFVIDACRVIPDVFSSMSHQSLKRCHFLRINWLTLIYPFPFHHQQTAPPVRPLEVGGTYYQLRHLITHQGTALSPPLKPSYFFYSELSCLGTMSFKPCLYTLWLALYCVVYFNDLILVDMNPVLLILDSLTTSS